MTDIVERLRDRDAVVLSGLFHAIPVMLDAASEIDRLRAALKGMADVAGDIPDHWADSHQCMTECGHFRRARAALALSSRDRP